MDKTHTGDNEPYLVIRSITKTFGDLVALNDVSLSVHEGEFVCLLGPSGCGKTTLLRIIAGLEQQNVGQIFQAGKDVSRLPPRERDFGIVFQSYALFPNLTATENIAYGLENRKVPKKAVAEKVTELLNLIGLPDVGKKYPAQLSGGQQQRVALARALATSPGLLLLDEPLSALDARVRISLRLEIKHLQEQLGVTTVFVTHDQEEALVMADRIVVMNQGTIEQVGTPEQIYRSPASPYVADFVGMMNFIPVETMDTLDKVKLGSLLLMCSLPEHFEPGHPATVAIRPEEIRLVAENGPGPNTLKVTVSELEFLGSFCRLTCKLEEEDRTSLVIEVSDNRMRELSLDIGHHLCLYLPPELIRVYPEKVAI